MRGVVPPRGKITYHTHIGGKLGEGEKSEHTNTQKLRYGGGKSLFLEHRQNSYIFWWVRCIYVFLEEGINILWDYSSYT